MSSLWIFLTIVALALMGIGLWKGNYYSQLGHNNLAAQVLGFYFVFFIYGIFSESKLWLRILLAGVSFCLLLYILLLVNRSVVVALVLVATFWFVHWKRSESYRTVLLLAVIVASSLAFVLLWANSDTFAALLRGKGWNSSFRLKIWYNTLLMIGDHWWGIGAQNFAFHNVFYNKEGYEISFRNVLNRSPHNEFLRFIVEDGILSAICLFTFWGKKIREAYRKCGSKQKPLLLGLVLFLLTEMFFQFPFENPTSFYFLAIFFGYLLRAATQGEMTLSRPTSRTFLLPIVLFFSHTGGSIAYAAYVQTQHSTEIEKLLRACQLHPGNYYPCLKAARIFLFSGNPSEVIRVTDTVLEQSPYNFQALQMKAAGLLGVEQKKEACQILAVVDYNFRGLDSVVGPTLCGSSLPKDSEILAIRRRLGIP